MPWIRQVRVTITNKDDGKSTIYGWDDDGIVNHALEFNVRSTLGWGSDTADLTIFNLSMEEAKALQDKSYGNRYITIEAGYVDTSMNNSFAGGSNTYTKNAKVSNSSLSNRASSGAQTFGGGVVFTGTITNAISFRQPPEFVTKLFCISRAYEQATTFSQMKNIKPGTSLIDAINSMCSDYGYKKTTYFGVDMAFMEDTKLKRGRVFHDTFFEEFRKLLGEYNLSFFLSSNEIQIFPETYGNKDAVDRMVKDRGVIKLDANQVIGNPIMGIGNLNLSTFLNSSIQAGQIIDISPLLGTEILLNGVVNPFNTGGILNQDSSVFKYGASDKYQIVELVHTGATHSQQYSTNIMAKLGGNTILGGNEETWMDKYKDSGMATEWNG